MSVQIVGIRSAGSNDKKQYAPKFTLAMGVGFIGDDAAEFILEQRVKWLRHREDMLVLQKEFAKERDYARFFKEEAGHALKWYRAACLLAPHVAANPPGDCPLRDPYEFPEELWPMLCHLEGMATCRN